MGFFVCHGSSNSMVACAPSFWMFFTPKNPASEFTTSLSVTSSARFRTTTLLLRLSIAKAPRAALSASVRPASRLSDLRCIVICFWKSAIRCAVTSFRSTSCRKVPSNSLQAASSSARTSVSASASLVCAAFPEVFSSS